MCGRFEGFDDTHGLASMQSLESVTGARLRRELLRTRAAARGHAELPIVALQLEYPERRIPLLRALGKVQVKRLGICGSVELHRALVHRAHPERLKLIAVH